MMAGKVVVNDKPWRTLRANLKGVDGKALRVGVLASTGGMAQHSDRTHLSLIEIAAIHEFGSPAANVPERSFIRRTFLEKSDAFKVVIAKVAKALVQGKLDPQRALELLGVWASTEVRNTVALGPHIPPPLKEETVRRKGSDRPLVDTGRLLGAIQWEVVDR